ncbi:hypothetical protein [Aurantimonas sp. HBX-1]|uniref:hypothetical protein n=1 Tax=Aurantimonas sp. HBX-1 TaxID=2906072 RepID=UPI001F1EC541|nr:hypothetical protein [Aurantimonas sp. HBX-1]UIJ70438.1 hypothetical protein LXB15_11740 [Aurantimonas sp. HBX-1]
MSSTLARSLAVAATLAVGAMATAAPAAADSFRLGVTIGGAPVHHVRDYRPHRPALCEPGQALRKAERMGVRRAHVRNVNRRAVVVAGRSRGDRTVVRFARAPGCPVISFRR